MFLGKFLVVSLIAKWLLSFSLMSIIWPNALAPNSAADWYVKGATKNNAAAAALKLQQVTADAVSGDKTIQFTTNGPLAHVLLKADSIAGGYLRVDTDKKVYAVSQYDPAKNVDDLQASKFQVMFLTELEVALFNLRPANVQKTEWLTKDTKDITKDSFLKTLNAYANLAKDTLTSDQLDLLIGEFANFIKFVTQGSDDNHKRFYNEFIKDSTLVDKINELFEAFKNLLKTPDAANVLNNASQSWEFGYSELIEGLPANNDIVVVKSEASGKYLTVVQEKDVNFKDVYYLSFASEDPVSATQFKVVQVGGRLGFVCQSKLGKDLVVAAAIPVVDSNVATVQRKITRLMLLPKTRGVTFGAKGSEWEQFQVTKDSYTIQDKDGKNQVMSGFSLQSLGLADSVTENSGKGYWTIDATDPDMLRVMNDQKVAIARTSTAGDALQLFSFVNITDSKDFYDTLIQARAQTDLNARMTVYIAMLDRLANTANALVLLQELKNFMTENKKTSDKWQVFLRAVADSFATFFEKFETIFGAGNAATKDKEQEIKDFLAAPFVEELVNGDYVIAWTNGKGEKKFLTLVQESENLPENYGTLFKVAATGSDMFDAASLFTFKVDAENNEVEIRINYKEDETLGAKTGDAFDGPNDHLSKGADGKDEAAYTNVKLCVDAYMDNKSGNILNCTGGTALAKYLRVAAWRDSGFNNNQQNSFKFKYQGSFSNMSLQSILSGGFLTVNPTTGLLEVFDADEAPISQPLGNSVFSVIPITKEQKNLIVVRGQTITQQVAYYSRILDSFDAQTEKVWRQQVVDEVAKMITTAVSDAKKYAVAKASEGQINLLIAVLNDTKKVATSKVIAEKAARVKALWEGGFAGCFENERFYAFTFKDVDGTQKVVRAVKPTKIDATKTDTTMPNNVYSLQLFTYAGLQDCLDPYSKFQAIVLEDESVCLALIDDKKDIYLLTLQDTYTTAEKVYSNYTPVIAPGDLKFVKITEDQLKAITDAKKNVVFKKLGDLTGALALTNLQKFKAVQEIGTFVALQSMNSKYGFISAHASDVADTTTGQRGVSTLSELDSTKPAGLKDSDGNLNPSDLAKFVKFPLTDVHVILADIRDEPNDIERLPSYFDVAAYQGLTDQTKEALASELIYWVMQISKDKTKYDALSANKAFSSQLAVLLNKVKGIVPSGSEFAQKLSDIKDAWLGGYIGEKDEDYPAADSKLIFRVSLKVTGPDADGKYMRSNAGTDTYFYLRAMQDEELGKLVLKAASTNSVDSACLLQVLNRGERYGFKSVANNGLVLYHKPLPSDKNALDEIKMMSPTGKMEQLALTFVDAATAKFESNAPTGAQFLFEDAVVDTTTKVVTSYLQEMTSSGCLRIDNDFVARVVDFGGVTHVDKAATAQISVLRAGEMYELAAQTIAEKDMAKRMGVFKQLVRKTRPDTYEKTFFKDTFSAVFKDQKTLDICRKAVDVVEDIKTEWGKTDDVFAADPELKAIADIADSSIPLGNKYVVAIEKLLKTSLKGTKDREADMQKFVGDYLVPFWEKAILDYTITNTEENKTTLWTNELIGKELKIIKDVPALSSNNAANVAKIEQANAAALAKYKDKFVMQRIKALNDLISATDLLAKQEKKQAFGFKEVYDAIMAKRRELSAYKNTLQASGVTAAQGSAANDLLLEMQTAAAGGRR